MKKYILLIYLMFFVGFISANTCSLNLQLVNQDPYPAVPGETVNVLLQMTGVENSACKDVKINLVESYPFTLDSSTPQTNSIRGGTYVQDYSSHWMIPYKLRIDKNAIEGFNDLKIIYTTPTGTEITKTFQIKVEEVKTNFEVYLSDYSIAKQTFTLEIINIGKNNIEALVVEIPQQDGVKIFGSNKKIIGVLDSKEDTSVTFEGVLNKSNIDVILKYNDKINERREIVENIKFDLNSFISKNSNGKKTSKTTYVIIAAIALILIYLICRRFIKKNKKKD